MPIDLKNPFNEQDFSAETAVARQEANMNILAVHYPNIHQQIINHGSLNVTVRVNTASEKADIIDESGSHYGGDAFQYTKKEIVNFLNLFGPGCCMPTMKPSYAGDYYFPRFFNQIADHLISHSPLQKEDNLQAYQIPSFYPHIVFLGCGFGLHIEYFLKAHRVHRVLVLEPDLNLFIASLATIDWKGIIEARVEQGLPKISLFLGGKGNVVIQESAIWNYLIKQCPVFPISTIYYIHRQQQDFKRICAGFERNCMSI